VKAVVIGTGRIACAVAGQAFRASGMEVVFIGRNASMVDHLNRTRRYIVRLVDSGSVENHEVTGVRAVLTSDGDRAADEIASADIIATAVGCENLLSIAPLIARGLRRRRSPVNVLAFENFGSAGECLQQFVQACRPSGFSGALVTRVVARREGDPAGDEPLVFVGDPPNGFYVDGTTLCGPLPAVGWMHISARYPLMVQRKLFTFSAGHATAAYLGYLKGYRYIHTAVRDREIRAAVLAVMTEGQKALVARHGSAAADDLQKILARFDNAALNDSVERVGRDPLRKLAAEDRLVGAARLAQQAGFEPKKLLLAIAAAMLFCPLADPAARQLRHTIRCDGPAAALCRVAGFTAGDTLACSAVAEYRRLIEQKPDESQLLSLDRMVWA